MAVETLRDFLVSIGFAVNQDQERRFVSSLEGATLRAHLLGDAIEGAARKIANSVASAAEDFEKLFYSSRDAKMAARDMESLEFAASQLGSSVDDARSSLEGMGQAIRENTGAAQAYEKFGFIVNKVTGQVTYDMKRAAEGVGQMTENQFESWRKLTSFSERFGQAIRRNPFEVGALIAKNDADMDRAGYDPKTAADAGTKFERVWRDTLQKVENLGKGFRTDLAADLTGPLQELDKFLEANEPAIEKAIKTITSAIGDMTSAWVNDFETAMKDPAFLKNAQDGMQAFAESIKHAADSLHTLVADVKWINDQANSFANILNYMTGQPEVPAGDTAGKDPAPGTWMRTLNPTADDITEGLNNRSGLRGAPAPGTVGDYKGWSRAIWDVLKNAYITEPVKKWDGPPGTSPEQNPFVENVNKFMVWLSRVSGFSAHGEEMPKSAPASPFGDMRGIGHFPPDGKLTVDGAPVSSSNPMPVVAVLPQKDQLDQEWRDRGGATPGAGLSSQTVSGGNAAPPPTDTRNWWQRFAPTALGGQQPPAATSPVPDNRNWWQRHAPAALGGKEAPQAPAAGQAGLGTIADYQNEPGDTRADLNRNPGNIAWGKWAAAHGATGSAGEDTGHGVAVFPTAQAGFEAMRSLALEKYNEGLKTARQIIATPGKGWTPGSPYAGSNISKDMGLDVDEDLKLNDPARMKSFMEALTRQEGAPKLLKALQAAKGGLAGGAPGVLGNVGDTQIVGGANLMSSGEFTRKTGIVPQVGADLVQVETAGGHKFTVNKYGAANFKAFVEDLEKRGYKFSGNPQGYNPRSNFSDSGRPSEHAYGNAIDINPGANPYTRNVNAPMQSDLPSDISSTAAKYGLSWGGDWHSVKDPMHFEYRGVPLQAGQSQQSPVLTVDQAAEAFKKSQIEAYKSPRNPFRGMLVGSANAAEVPPTISSPFGTLDPTVFAKKPVSSPYGDLGGISAESMQAHSKAFSAALANHALGASYGDVDNSSTTTNHNNNIDQKININIDGTGDPTAAARMIGAHVDWANSNVISNLMGSVR